MTDVYLWDETVGASDVVLRMSSAETITSVVASGPPIIQYRPKRTPRRDDEEALLVAALI